jgi:hypothetical protein
VGAQVSDERLDQLERGQADLERRFAEAFPGGDHVGHCRYHQLMIEGIDAKKRLREAIIQKTIAGLVWGAMIGLGLAVWQYVKALLKG